MKSFIEFINSVSRINEVSRSYDSILDTYNFFKKQGKDPEKHMTQLELEYLKSGGDSDDPYHETSIDKLITLMNFGYEHDDKAKGRSLMMMALSRAGSLGIDNTELLKEFQRRSAGQNQKFTDIDAYHGRYSNIEEIDNWLVKIKKGKWQNEYRGKLRLNNAHIKELPKEFGQIRGIGTLYMMHNQLKKLPKEFGQLQSLNYLNLFNNQLVELPKEIGQLQNLEELYLSDNNLRELPKEIGQLINLRYLHLFDNNLKELPKEIGQLQNLKELYLGQGNDLGDIIWLKNMLPKCDIIY